MGSARRVARSRRGLLSDLRDHCQGLSDKSQGKRFALSRIIHQQGTSRTLSHVPVNFSMYRRIISDARLLSVQPQLCVPSLLLDIPSCQFARSLVQRRHGQNKALYDPMRRDMSMLLLYCVDQPVSRQWLVVMRKDRDQESKINDQRSGRTNPDPPRDLRPWSRNSRVHSTPCPSPDPPIPAYR